MVLKRKVIHVEKLSGHLDDNYVDASMEERIGMVWPLTMEVASLSPQHNVEQRLQRHIGILTKRGR